MIKRFGDLTLQELAELYYYAKDCTSDSCPLRIPKLCGSFPHCPLEMMKDMSNEFDTKIEVPDYE